MKHRGLYNITNVNTRVLKEGKEDGDLAVDVNFENTVHRGVLLELFDQHQIDAIIAGIFDEDGKPLNVGVKALELDNEFTGTVRISLGLKNWAVFGEAKVCKLKLEPNGAGTFKLKGQIQGVPSEGDLEPLCHLQKDRTEIEFEVTPPVTAATSDRESQGSMPLSEAA